MMGLKDVLLQWFMDFFDKKTSGDAVKNGNMSNQHPLELAHVDKVCNRMLEVPEESHKPTISKF